MEDKMQKVNEVEGKQDGWMRLMEGLYGRKNGQIKDRWRETFIGNGCQKDDQKHVSGDGIYQDQDSKEYGG